MKDSAPLPNLKVEYQPVAALKCNPQNSRTHPKSQIKQIAESIRAFGFTNPVLIDRSDMVVAGHGRLAAAKILGLEQIPTIRLEALSADQLRAYIIADNRLAEKGGWDKAILAVELEQLSKIKDLDVVLTGFDVTEINLAIQPVKKKRHRKSTGPNSSRAATKSGDTWILGEHLILCGTSDKPASYEALDIVIRAWQEHTGDRAIHAQTGKSFNDILRYGEAVHE